MSYGIIFWRAIRPIASLIFQFQKRIIRIILRIETLAINCLKKKVKYSSTVVPIHIYIIKICS